MKIIHVIYSLEVGGAQKLLTNILPLMKDKGFDVSVLVFFRLYNSFEHTIERNGIEIMSLNTRRKFSIKMFISIIQTLKKWNIVHVHLFPALYVISLVSVFLPSLKLVYTEHSTHNRRREKKILKYVECLVYSRYKKTISISHQTQERLLEWISFDNKKSQLVVVENGVNLADYALHINITDRTETKMVLMISRFSEQKDQATLIRALKFIKTPGVIVVFAGEGSNIEKCKDLAKRINVYDRVRFLGNRNDIPKLISESDIGVQSSLWEGFGLTAVEFMAGGKPIIASNVNGLKQVVEGAGLLFEVGNHQELAGKIDLLLNDRAYYEMISKRCVERSKVYDINNMVNKYIDIYNEIYTC